MLHLEQPAPRKRTRIWLRALFVLVPVAVIASLVSMLGKGSHTIPHREPPHITQVALPPPPPPPPPPPKEPPKQAEQPKPFEQVKPEPSRPQPPANPLTADVGPGANNFGLSPGNGGDTIGGGGTGNPFAGYAYVVQQSVQQALQRDDDVRKGRYAAVVALWVSPDGTIQRLRFVSSTGKPEIDAAIEKALQGRPLPQPPPANLPQPINLRIGAVATG